MYKSKQKQKFIFALGIFLVGLPAAFASSEYEKVDPRLLQKSFSENKYEQEYLKVCEATPLNVFYSKFVRGLDNMKKTELKYRTLYTLGSSASHYNSRREVTEDAATSYMTHQLKVAFNYGLRNSPIFVGELTRGFKKEVDFISFLKSSENSAKDNIRYDLVATGIRQNPNRLYRAELNADDMEILQYIPQDHIEWGIEPVVTKDLNKAATLKKPDDSFWKNPTAVNTSVRMTAPRQADQMVGVVLGASTLDNHYQVNYNTAAESQNTFVTHSLYLPTKAANFSSEFTSDLHLRKLSTSMVRSKANDNSMSLNYYNIDRDISAEYYIPGKDMEYIFGASISLD